MLFLVALDEEMVQSALDMFNGGLVSSLSGLEFLFLFLMHNPDIQHTIQREIDDVIGANHKPSWVDQSKMSFTVATITETLRLASITPSTLPHVPVRDVTIHDYSVPKGTGVVASIFCLHRQPDVYENPETFNPERFLNKDNTLRSFENFIPFGVGKLMDIFPSISITCSKFTYRHTHFQNISCFRLNNTN